MTTEQTMSTTSEPRDNTSELVVEKNELLETFEERFELEDSQETSDAFIELLRFYVPKGKEFRQVRRIFINCIKHAKNEGLQEIIKQCKHKTQKII